VKKCKNCKKPFEPARPLQNVCGLECAIELSNKKGKSDWKLRKKTIKESLKTKKDYLNELQVIFNSWVRTRDKHKSCISCGCILSGKYDAGHYFSVGLYPELRFNEDNNHGQCVACNQHKHGNLLEYRFKLIERIGEKRFAELEALKSKSVHYSIADIKELTIYYKGLLKIMQCNEN
jgi:hypothetical protein